MFLQPYRPTYVIIRYVVTVISLTSVCFLLVKLLFLCLIVCLIFVSLPLAGELKIIICLRCARVMSDTRPKAAAAAAAAFTVTT